MRGDPPGEPQRSPPPQPSAADAQPASTALPISRASAALRSWRLAASRAFNKPKCQILLIKTLDELAVLRPTTASQLLSVPGVTQHTVDEYGDAILVVIATSAVSSSNTASLPLSAAAAAPPPPPPSSASLSPASAALRAWRQAASRAAGVPACRILLIKTLDNVAALRPTTLGQLMSVPGVPQHTADMYGKAILAAVASSVAPSSSSKGGDKRAAGDAPSPPQRPPPRKKARVEDSYTPSPPPPPPPRPATAPAPAAAAPSASAAIAAAAPPPPPPPPACAAIVAVAVALRAWRAGVAILGRPRLRLPDRRRLGRSLGLSTERHAKPGQRFGVQRRGGGGGARSGETGAHFASARRFAAGCARGTLTLAGVMAHPWGRCGMFFWRCKAAGTFKHTHHEFLQNM